MNAIEVKVNGGYLRATANLDPDYPGIDVEFISDDDNGQHISRPRILMEKPADDGLRCLIWNNRNSEDYKKEIDFREA